MYSRKTKKPQLQPVAAPKSVATAVQDASSESTAQLARQEIVNRSATVQTKGHNKSLYMNITATVDGEEQTFRGVKIGPVKSHPPKQDYSALALQEVQSQVGQEAVVVIVSVSTYTHD